MKMEIQRIARRSGYTMGRLLLIRPKGDGTQECYRVEGANFRGEDAYDVAKAGGYTGTRDEWVAQIQKVSMVDIVFDEEKGAIVIRS